MRLRDILHPECVKVPLAAQNKQEAIFELVDLLAEHGLVGNREELKQTVWQREMTRTTGIGHGVAIPHGKAAGVSRLALAVGKTAQPLEFNAIDGRPVELIFLLASPADQTGPHIQALASISRILADPAFRAAMRAAGTAQELYQLIVEHENKHVTV